MKALTLWQPWASLIAVGAKWIETRSWPTSHRGPLAIHAGLRYEPFRLDAREGWTSGSQMLWDNDADKSRHDYFTPVPLGAVVATAELVDVVPIVDVLSGRGPNDHDAHGRAVYVLPDGLELVDRFKYRDDPEHTQVVTDQGPYGDFSPGRWAWLLADIQGVEPPVPARGRQQLWEWAA